MANVLDFIDDLVCSISDVFLNLGDNILEWTFDCADFILDVLEWAFPSLDETWCDSNASCRTESPAWVDDLIADIYKENG
jgi:hypothetical protein